MGKGMENSSVREERREMNMNLNVNRLWRMVVIGVLDALLLGVAVGASIMVRFDFAASQIPPEHLKNAGSCLLVQVVVTVVVFTWRRMYHYIWRTINVMDVAGMCTSVVIAYVVGYICCSFLQLTLPRSVWFMDLVFQLMFLVGMRCSLRFLLVCQTFLINRRPDSQRIMLIGAGQAGRILAHELCRSRRVEGKLCCVIDDNSQVQGKYLDGVRIVGGREKIQSAVKQYGITQIIFAIPTISPDQKTEILNICKMTGCRLRVLPGLYQMLNGEVSLSAVKDVQVEDLLGRTPVQLNKAVVSDFLEDKVVMVTGGGGSIGSELCRQIAMCHPRRLIVLDIYENNAYDVQQELVGIYGNRLDLRVEICSVRDKTRVYQIFEQYRPQVVFHAAAHKHVPLMESCPDEAIKNNIFGTYHVVRAAEKFGVEKFVMISTDKAVNPTNLMGATKRYCEMILPNGGPVTITDKRIIRYFMTIPEAAMLVLEAGAMAKQSQIFVLDMGKPVKILTLAENLIRLSGLEPYKDIEIKEIGLRPGEKLYEELLMKSEHLINTENEKIFIEEQQLIPPEVIMRGLVALDRCVSDQRPKDELVALMRRLVPTYREPEEVNREAIARMEEAAV